VQHRARQHGVSKFGVGRFFDGFLDLLTVLMVTRYRTRPLHLFGILGAGMGSVGLLLLVYLSILWFMGEPIGSRPLLMLGVLLTLAAIQLIGVGLVSELLVRTTITPHEVFSIKSTRGFGEEPSRPAALPAGPGRPSLAASEADRPATSKPATNELADAQPSTELAEA